LRFVLDHSLLLIGGAAAGLVWGNLSPRTYLPLADAARFLVNDIGMVFFFALAAKEVVEATLPGGPLGSPRRAAVPVLAAVGGMLGPAVLYTALVLWRGAPHLARGWAIPCATDIAFSSLVARLIFGRRHGAVPFLLLLAIADDALGLVILAVAYPAGDIDAVIFGGLLGAGLAGAWALRRRRVQSTWPYLLGPGTVCWLACFRGGLHPALALVPVVPFIPHAQVLHGWGMGRSTGHDPLNRFEHQWRVPVQVILLGFGFVNAGVPLSEVGPGTWAVLASLIVGKPTGILLLIAVASSCGLHRPAGVTWPDLLVVGCAAGIGFTVSLFFATAAFADPLLLAQAKMGALLSVAAAVLALSAAALLGVGRFARAGRALVGA
jgi:NhaA family Na+:H+ antiporter